MARAVVNRAHKHVLSRDDINTDDLPKPTLLQKKDGIYKIEQLMWAGNLSVFFLALTAALFLFSTGPISVALTCVAAMLFCFVCGYIFTIKVPNTPLAEFEAALNHGENLLVVNAPRNKVLETGNFIHRRHPEAIMGSVAWSTDVFQL